MYNDTLNMSCKRERARGASGVRGDKRGETSAGLESTMRVSKTRVVLLYSVSFVLRYTREMVLRDETHSTGQMGKAHHDETLALSLHAILALALP